jgi:hypothetical protein
MEGGKGPGNPLKGQTGSDMGIVSDVVVVVEVDKVVTVHLPEDGENGYNESQAYEKLTTHE